MPTFTAAHPERLPSVSTSKPIVHCDNDLAIEAGSGLPIFMDAISVEVAARLIGWVVGRNMLQ
jgi:hypothetical protein